MRRMETLEWVSISMKNGNNLFLSSEIGVPVLCQRFDIDSGNVADMRSISEEMMMDGRKGLKKFTDILDGIQDLDHDIAIHCRLGLNRTPIAAVIFLVERMSYSPAEAQAVVESALRGRKQDYVLNEMGLYQTVLQEVAVRYEHRSPARLFHRAKQHIREMDEINKQKQQWYQ